MSHTQTIMYREICEQPDVLKQAALANANTIKLIASAFGKEKPANAVLAARGTSDHAGVYFKYLFETVAGLPVALAAPSVLTLYDGKLNLSNSLVIAVSQSGKAADALEVIRKGNKDGALTVSVTNNLDSPLAKEAKFHLYCAAGEEKSVAATKTFTSEAYLLALLTAEISGDTELKLQLQKAPELTREALKSEGEVLKAARTFADSPDCYILGRGLIYSAVLEAALKLQETSYIRAKAYAYSDFVHGPFAVLDKGTKVVMLAPRDESLQGAVEAAQKALNVGACLTVITNSTAFDNLQNTSVIRMPQDANKYNALFAAAPIIQLFACALSTAKGLSPDTPRNLNKITVTK